MEPSTRQSADDSRTTDRLCRLLDSWVAATVQYQIQAAQTRYVLVFGVITLGVGTAAMLAQAGSPTLASVFLLMMVGCVLFLNHAYGGWSTAWERTCAKLAALQYKIAEKGAEAALGGARRLPAPQAIAEKERRGYRVSPLDPISKVLYLVATILLFCLFLFLVDQQYSITIDVNLDPRSPIM